MRLTIITIVYNNQSEIEDTIKSVLKNRNPDIEYILIDGGSTDATMEIVERYRAQFAHIVSEKDDGISDAFNKGIRLATGDLIGMINAGDFLMDNTYSLLERAYSPSIDVYYGDSTTLYEEGHRVVQKALPLHHIRYRMPFCHQSTFVSRTAYGKYGVYSLDYRICMDYELFYRMFSRGAKFQYIPEPLSEFRRGGVSDTNYRKILEEKKKVAVRYGKHTVAMDLYYRAWAMKFWVRKWVKRFGLLGTFRRIRDKARTDR